MRHDQFEQLYAEHARDVYAFLAYRTGDAARAEDLLADTFEKVLRAHRRFDPRRGSRRTWLYAIALNVLRDDVRHRDAERRALERVGPPAVEGELERGIESLGTRVAVVDALEQLSPEERDAIALRYGGELTAPEIARLTRQRLTTIEGRLARGMRKLRALLAE